MADKELLTITRVGDAVRVSRVTAHGEEILETDPETKALAMLLWARLATEGSMRGDKAVWPWEVLTANQAKVHRFTTALEDVLKALRDLNATLHNFKWPPYHAVPWHCGMPLNR